MIQLLQSGESTQSIGFCEGVDNIGMNSGLGLVYTWTSEGTRILAVESHKRAQRTILLLVG